MSKKPRTKKHCKAAAWHRLPYNPESKTSRMTFVKGQLSANILFIFEWQSLSLDDKHFFAEGNLEISIPMVFAEYCEND